MRRRWPLLAGFLVAAGLACGSPGARSVTPSTDPLVSVSDLTVDVGGAEAGLFLPPPDAADAVPVVVMLHGTEGDRTHLYGLAGEVAGRGALVYVPSWPAIDMSEPYPADEGDEPFRRQSESVVCALRGVRVDAPDRGGDPDDLTVVGQSGGAMIGARVAMVDDPPWAGIDCLPDVEHRPDRFIGLSGDYTGKNQYSWAVTGLYEPYDLFSIEPTNRDLEVWLFHGNNDRLTPVQGADRLTDTLRAAGIPAHLVTTDLAHGDMIDAESPGSHFAADRIASLVARGAGSEEEPQPLEAALWFDHRGRCSYTGPTGIAPWDEQAIELRNDSDDPVWFVLASVRRSAAPGLDELLGGEGELVVDRPDWIEYGGFVEVGPDESKLLRFVMVGAEQRFVVYCHTDPHISDDRANWMYAAAVLTPVAATSGSE